MPLSIDVESQPPLLTLACRFMPYDQWLTTHVDGDWKVKQVKLWILSKCLGVPLDASLFPSASGAVNSDVWDGSMVSGQRYRPKSPITFAPDPRTLRRPISPILFAKGGKRKAKDKVKDKDEDGKGKAETEGGAEGDNGSSNELTPTGSPVDGYEGSAEDYDTADEGGSLYDDPQSPSRSQPPPPSLPAPLPPRSPTPVLPTPPASNRWARYNLAPNAYTLIRFSTGQALEDDLSLTFFDLSSYELLELHAHGDICAPPTNWTSSSASTISHASTSEHGYTGHTRNGSIYSLPGPNAPSPPPYKTKDKDKDKEPPQHIYLPHLNRFDLQKYVLPYWEGSVRELRSVPTKSFLSPMPHFLNGYGYGYSGPEISERAMALGIGPPPFGLNPPGMKGAGWDVKVTGGTGGRNDVRVGNKIEWRRRHVVIKEGLFTLCTSRHDPNPRHIIPVEAFTSLNDADTVLSYLRGRDHQQSQTQPKPHPTSASTSRSTSHHPYSSYSNFAPPKPSSRSRYKNHSSRYSTSTLGPVFSQASDASDSDIDSREGLAYSQNPSSHYSHGRGQNREDSDTHSHAYEHEGDDDDDAPKTIADELVDDLRIVVLKFRSADRRRKVLGSDKNGMASFRYVREKERGEGEDKERKGTGKKDKKGKGKEREGKGRGRGTAFPWDREGKDKDDKRKGKERRDWIPGFRGKRDRNREQNDRERGGRSLSGLGRGVSLGRGLHDAKLAREQEREWAREKVALSEADAEAKIVFARRSEADTSSVEDDKDVGSGMGGNGEMHWARKEVENAEAEPRAEGEEDKDKGNAKEEVGEADGGADADEEGDDGDLSTDADGDADSSFTHVRDTSQSQVSHSHAHPTSALVNVVNANEGDGEESEAWSSPVFARSGNSTDLGSDGEWSDIGFASPSRGHGGDAYKYAYRYGYQGSNLAAVAGRLDTESVGEEKDRLEKEQANFERRRQKETAQRKEEEVKRENERIEWIILDVGNDCAYRSFLRVLHRHLAPTAPSDFIPLVFSAATPTSTTPTQTLTPFPSPTSPHAGSGSQSFQWFQSSDDEEAPTGSTSTTLTISSRRSRDSHPSPISASSETSNQTFPHPTALASLSHGAARPSHRFGVLPYPEWRLELTERAQRAGMGDVGPVMRWIKWENHAQLELDIEELRRRHNANDDGSDRASKESLRKKKKATSLKNRRRSTTSTLTAKGMVMQKDVDKDGEGERMIYDSDVSEDMGTMLEMSDSEEGSEAEWHGWVADLHRQRQISEQRARQEAERRIKEAAEAAAPRVTSEGEYGEPTADGDEIRNRRLRLEPKGVISVRRTEDSGLNISHSTSATLYSQSSSDSLNRAAFYRSSSPAETSAHSHNSRGASLSPSLPGGHKHTLPVGSSLSHSTSMYASIRSESDAHAAEQNLRRPSMPILTSDHTFPLHHGSVIVPQSSVIRSPIASKFSFPSSTTNSPPYSPSFSSSFPVEDVLPNVPSVSRSPSEFSSAAMSRRASSAGLTNQGGPLGRSTSMLSRGGLLRKDAGKEAERLRERERRKEEKAKEKEDKAKEKERVKESEREAKEARKLQRPKLSLATSSTHQLVPQPATGVVRNKSKVETGKSLLRRVKSGSNLNEQIIIDESKMPDSTKDVGNAQKKKRGVFVNRFVRGLDSAMDFVDGL